MKSGKTRAALEEELRITDVLLSARQRIVDLIPPCPAHGKGCIPHAEEWIASAKLKMEEAPHGLPASR